MFGCCLLYAGDGKTPPDGPIVFFEDTKVRGLECVGYNSVWSHLGVPKNALLLEREKYLVAVPLAEIEGLRITRFTGNMQTGARVAAGEYRRADKVYDLKGSTMPHVLLSGWTQSATDGLWRFGHLIDNSTRMWHPYVKKALAAPPQGAPRVVAKVMLANDGKLTLRNPGFGWSYSEPGQIAVELNNVIYAPRQRTKGRMKLDTFPLDSVARMAWSQAANTRHLEFTTRTGETRSLWMMGGHRFVTGEGDEGQLYILMEDLKSIEFEVEPKP
jgi:hypothetical protein